MDAAFSVSKKLEARNVWEYCVLELNPHFGGGFPFSYEAGVNLPKAIMEWVKGDASTCSTTDIKNMLQPTYGKMFAKNDYLMEIK